MSLRLAPYTKNRIIWLFLTSFFFLFLLWARLAYMQIVRYPFYEAAALEQRYRAEPLVPERGTIYDRQGVPLAMTTYGFGVYVNPRLMVDRAETARALARTLAVDMETIEAALQSPNGSVWVAHRLAPETAAAVEALQLPGVYVVQRPHRDYPNGPLAADVLGLTGVDNQGLGGVEWAYDDDLKGVPGKFFSERDPRGRVIAGGRQAVVASAPAHDLVLTIDHVLQYITEQELGRGLAQAKASWGLALMLQPATGEILALSVLPAFDPRDFKSALPRAYRNPAVSDQFEPGSTLKVFTAAAALEEGILQLDSTLPSPNSLRIGGRVIHNFNHIDHGTLTLKDAVAVSSNTAFAQLGAHQVGGQTLARYMEAFGFGQRLGVDLPGEGTGSVPTPGRIDGEQLRWANVAFGQGIAVTPLQLAAATAVIANGGHLMRPYVVREVLGADGARVEGRQPTRLRQVISPRTAEDIAEAMEAAVVHGTGSRAQVAGYRVAGKTGTAQIPEGGVYGGKRLASFIGFAPVDRPAFVLVVMLYDVQQDTAEGGRWAAPIFSAIAARALPYLGVPPQF